MNEEINQATPLWVHKI